MADKTFIVKLASDSKQYQTGVNQARKSLDQFQKQNLSTAAAMKTLTSTLSKFISVAALAKGAQEAFNKVVQGSQTTADAWAASMAAAKASVDNLFSSISTGDFSVFSMGLEKIAANAKAAAMALDQLGNASMSWSYFQTAGTADLTELQAIVSDTERSVAERTAAATQMAAIRDRLQKYADKYEQIALEAMAKEMTAATNIPWTNVTRADLEKVLELDLLDTGMSAERKDELAAHYKEYTKRLGQITPIRGAIINGAKSQSYIRDEARYNAEVQALAASYQDAILYNEVLVRKSDEWLQNLIQIVQQADNAERSMRRVNSSVQSAEKTVAAFAVTPTPTAPTKKLGTLPGAAGLALLDVSGPTLPDKLPETVADLEDWDVLLARIAEHADASADGFDRMTAAADGFSSMGRSLESLGNAFAQIGGKGWQIAGNIISAAGAAIQAYTQMAQAAATAAAAEAAAETPTVYGKIAAVTTMLGAFAAMASSIQSSIRIYAEGGIITGQNYRDGITARVSSGEMVINEADQRRLYDTIHNGGYAGGGGPAVITGEQIVLAINNYGRRTNRGELVFAGKG